MTQAPTTTPSGRQDAVPSLSETSPLSSDELVKIVTMADQERRRFELDPRGYVDDQVQSKLRQLHAKGQLLNRAQEDQARLLYARYYQEQGGIESPRLLSNQERAGLVQNFRRADLATRVQMMNGLEASFSKEWPKVFGELVDGLPFAEQAGARHLFERFEYHRLHSVDPNIGLSIDGLSGNLRELSDLLERQPESAVADDFSLPVASYPRVQNFGAARPDLGPAQDEAELAQSLAESVASPNLGLTPGVTDDWTGPGLDAERSAVLAGLVEDILSASPDDLASLEDRIASDFGDDPFTVQRLVGLARARLGTGIDFLVPAGRSQTRAAEAALRFQRDLLRSGRDYNDQRREDRAAFAALEAESGLRLRLQDDGKIAIGEADETPLAVMSWSVARAIAREPEEVRERFALIERLITSREPDHALRNEIVHTLGRSGALNDETTPDAEARQAALDAPAAIRAGHDPVAIRAGLIAIFFPRVAQDPAAWSELLLDVLPIIGEIRSADDAIESFDTMVEALNHGDLGEAAKQGLLGVLSTAGALPALGPLFKTLRTLTRRALRTRRVAVALRSSDLLKKVHGRFAVARRRGRMPEFIRRISAEEAFAEVWPELTAGQKKLLKGLMPHFKGKPVELDFVRLLENAGMEVVSTGQDKLLLASGKETVLDAVSKNGFSDGIRLFANSFILPTPGAKGTIFEFKMGDAPPTSNQVGGKIAVDQAKAKGQSVTTKARVSVVDHEVLRYGFNELPEDLIEQEAERLLRNHANGVRSTRLSHADVDELVRVFVGWHRRLRHDTAGEVMTLAEAFIALGLAASERAARNALAAEADMSEQ